MFKKLIQNIFPSVAYDKGFTPDYTTFERDRPAATEPELPSLSRADKTLTTPKAGPFWDHLFGDSNNQQQQDPLSVFVANKINEIIMQSGELLADLPVMPTSVSRVIELLKNKEFNLPELLDVIEHEPSMAADMIKLANSSKYKRGDSQVTNLQKAFMYMGAEGLKEGVIEVFLKKFSASSNLYFKQFGEKIWTHSFNSANYAQSLALKHFDKSHGSTLYLVGLLRHLGTMVIFQLMIEAFKHVDPDAQPSSASFKWLMAEQSLNLTITIAKYWQLPNSIIELLMAQNKLETDNENGAFCVFDAAVISEAQALFDAKKLTSEQYKHYINTKVSQSDSAELGISLLEESI